MPRLVVLAALLWFSVVGNHVLVAGQEASPSVSVATRLSLDLAAMVLVAEDLPEGFSRGVGDTMTPGNLYGIVFAPHVSHERLAEAGLLRDYEAFYAAGEGPDSISVSIDEYATPEGAKAGFAVFAEETRPAPNFTPLAATDLPGPAAGDEPKMFTAITYEYRDGSISRFVDTTFRIENVTARVAYERFPQLVAETPGEAAATATAFDAEYLEQVEAVETMAAALAARVEAVLAGEVPPGAGPELAERVLPLTQLPDVWNGQSWEGYRDAEVVFDRDASMFERFSADFQHGYGRTVSLGTGSSPRPPFLSVAVARLAQSDAAEALLYAIRDAPTDLPETGPFGRGGPLSPVDSLSLTGADAAIAFTYALDTTEDEAPSDSAVVVFASGPDVVVVEAQGASSAEAALAMAQDLATQQVECLLSGDTCTAVSMPART